LNIFFILAFLPLIPSELYQMFFFGQTLGVIIPLYGLLILLIKRDQLSQYMQETNILQKALGVIIVLSSVFAHYAIAPFVPQAAFYGLANFTLHMIGLLLIFFRVSAFRQGLTFFFLMAASGLTGLTFRWIEAQMSPTVPYYVSLFSSLLTLFGISHTRPSPTTILLNTPRESLPIAIEAGCIGIYSVIVFSMLIVVTMIETPARRRTKLLWSAVGLIGVFVLNIIRLFIVILAMNFYGWDFGQSVHQVIGYVLFLSWMAAFLLLFSKREEILRRLQLTSG
jgi:exosortase/archaeosortase family protein